MCAIFSLVAACAGAATKAVATSAATPRAEIVLLNLVSNALKFT